MYYPTEEEKKAEKQKHIKDLLATIQPMSAYQSTFVDHCTHFAPRISTGLLNLDKALNGGLANELYIMGAETSTGKSAFLMFLAQKVAEAGTDVIYFGLEMAKDEFIARGISMISFEHHRQDDQSRLLTAGNVLYWTYDEQMRDFTKLAYPMYETYSNEYFTRYGSHMHIVENNLSRLTVEEITGAITERQKQTQRPMVVFVDYLQNIKADPDDRSQIDRKTRTDVSVATLKTLASQVGMPVVMASSIARGGYGEKVGTASFKESGDTEYTGGILLGWNWVGVTDEKDDQKVNEEKKVCKDRGYRRMTLDVLKYRNSERDSAVHLKYYPAYNYFEEDDGWEPLPDNGTVPFETKKKIYDLSKPKHK